MPAMPLPSQTLPVALAPPLAAWHCPQSGRAVAVWADRAERFVRGQRPVQWPRLFRPPWGRSVGASWFQPPSGWRPGLGFDLSTLNP